jgi:hypothetical protein
MGAMNRKLIALATVVLVAGIAVAVFGSVQRRSNHPAPATSSSHSNGIDHAMSSLLALYHAPVGATPCETAYNAFKASLDYSTQHNVTPVVIWLAPHDDFIARCSALPPPAQQCMVPVYISQHRPECQLAKPSDDALKTMAQLRQGEQSPDEPGTDLVPPPRSSL